MATRSARRRGRPHKLQSLGSFREPFAPEAGDWLNRNPNRGKHGAARQGLDGFDPATGRYIPTAEDIRIRDARRDYRPLTVKQHVTRDRIGRRLPVSRQHVSDGYTI